jgi:beta-lactam-binding protein with PASTA domain
MRPIWKVVALVMSVAAVAACDGVNDPIRPGKVPPVVGKTQTAAATAIKTACPDAVVRYEPADVLAQADRAKVLRDNIFVLAQGNQFQDATPSAAPRSASPAPRASGDPVRCATSGSLTITLTLGVYVPNLAGLTVADARTRLQQNGLQIGGDAKIADRHVVRQNPAAGQSVQLKKLPALTVEVGVDIKVPAVVGRSAKDACTLLVEAKLVCDPKPAGQPALVVATQVPAADAFVDPGVHVTLTLKQIATNTLIAVPSVAGRSKSEACALIVAAQLKCAAYESDSYGDDPFPVIRTDPTAGEKVGPGAQVLIWVPSPRYVPPLSGHKQDEACTMLVMMGLNCKPQTVAASDPSGTVIGQDPSEGTVLTKGKPVTLQIASGIVVPSVVGRTAQEACDLLFTSALSCGQGDVAPDWIVTGQSPEAGTPALKGTKVVLAGYKPTQSPSINNLGNSTECEGISVLGFCSEPNALVGSVVGVLTLMIGLLEFMRRRRNASRAS